MDIIWGVMSAHPKPRLIPPPKTETPPLRFQALSAAQVEYTSQDACEKGPELQGFPGERLEGEGTQPIRPDTDGGEVVPRTGFWVNGTSMGWSSWVLLSLRQSISLSEGEHHATPKQELGPMVAQVAHCLQLCPALLSNPRSFTVGIVVANR